MLSALVPLIAMTMSFGPARSWEGEVIYQIFPRSYRDSNGDRIGDLKGIIDGLDTVRTLGCTAILINPIQKSRVYHNYFADDLFAVDPEFGTLEDFRALCREAHERSLRVILDMEPQYVTDGHPWLRSVLGDPKSPYKAYLWKENPLAKMGGDIWYDKKHIEFAAVDPDNPKVRAYLTKVFLFWSEQGVDGFRIDHMMDDMDFAKVKTGMLAKLWSPLIEEVRRAKPGTFFVGEQARWESLADVREIFRQSGTDAAYAFPLYSALLSFDKAKIETAIRGMARLAPKGRMLLTFLENHDLPRFASNITDRRRQRLAALLLFVRRQHMVSTCASTWYPPFGVDTGCLSRRQAQWKVDENWFMA